jgi:drug/metabolite transporter (DMT)-like permease
MTAVTAQKHQPKALIILAFLALYIIWGSTYLGIKYAIETIPPFFMAGGRFTIAGLLLFAWCIIKKETIPSLKSIAVNCLAGILMLFVGNTAVVYSEQYLPSGLVAIVVATAPLWFVILDKRQWHFHFSNKIILAGLLVGFAGVLMLFAGKGSVGITGSKMKIISFFVLLIGSIGWVVGSLYSKYKKSDGSTIVKAAIQMLAGGVVAILAGFISSEQSGFALANVSTTSILALTYLITLGSLVAFIAYIWLLSVRPPSLVGTYAYVNPVVAVFLGWLIAGEAITSSQVIALSIVLVGVLIVNFSREKKVEQSIGKKKRTIDIQNPERSTEINTETSSAHGSV